MPWVVGLTKLQSLPGLVVVVEILAIFEVAEDDIIDVMSERGGPVQKRLNAVRRAGDRAQTNQANPTFPELVKMEIQEPFQNFVSGSGLKVRHDERVFTAQGFFNQDILSKLLVQVDLQGFGEEAG